MTRAADAVRVAGARGAPARRLVVRAVVAGAAAQLATIALVGGATGLLVWSAMRPGLGTVAGLLLAVEVVAFVRAPLRHAERLAAHDLGLGGLGGWRTWLLDSVATWSPSRLAAARAGDLLARCLEDTDQLQDLWVRAVVPSASTVVALLAASTLLAIAVPLAGGSLALGTVLLTWVTWARARRVAELGVAESALRGGIAARTVELAHGATALRLAGADAEHVATTLELVTRADRLAARRDGVIAQLGLLASVIAALVLFAAVASVALPTAHPAVAAGVVLAILACSELLAGLPGALDSLGAVAGAAERLGSLATPRAPGTSDAPLGALELDRVDVSAAALGPVLLTSVTLRVAPDGGVAVLGPTGSGKSSLLAVAAGLEDPRGGTVTLGDLDLATLEEHSLRRRIGWLPSHPALLEGTVRDVLDVGRGLDDATLSEVLVRVGLAETLESRGGLDAVVGPRGEGLSAGERHRLALARLLAGRPSVLVLDEPTAGLDEASSRTALEAVASSGAGVLLATHDARAAEWAATRRVVRDGTLADEPSRPVSR
jgi:ABC-type transport system involved in cytochrome bd biosynthesis fused ATPase/permease subunit